MNPASAISCRVLELGCGDGANILPMAAVLNGCRFVGIDLAQNPIVKATGMARALGLENIRFENMNVMDLGAGFGEFDYILAHGLYSWVPAAVRDKIMSVCQPLLSPNGIAYITSVARPVSTNPAIRSTKEEEFRGTKGGALRTGHPVWKAAVVRLGQSQAGANQFRPTDGRNHAVSGRPLILNPAVQILRIVPSR